MNTISSKIPLDSLIIALQEYIEQKLEEFTFSSFYSSPRVSVKYLEVLLRQPIVLYVDEKTLTANTPIENSQLLALLEKVHFVPNYILLIYIYLTYNVDQRRNKYITCVVMETKRNVVKADPLYNLIFLDFWLKKNNKTNTSGKIDYQKLEKIFRKIFSDGEYRRLLKKPGKYFCQSLLSLNINRKF